ncbi:hypothetical protein [Marinicellulosiphila megalodicopiae]|uniref:hypothetical protein n=1 Tax=Marinicellulosiphila megalodicopiae TaxID=2724896 RepID=UPI003BAE842D
MKRNTLTEYVQSLTSYKLGCILRPALDNTQIISHDLLNCITVELKSRNNYECELNRRLPH